MKHSKMYRAAQSGFTLIELMITLTIVGLIALIAAPIFTDYAIRARVAEVSSVFAPVRTGIGIYYAAQGTLPATLSQLSRELPTVNAASYAGEWVSNLDVGTSGVVTIELKAKDELGEASGHDIVYTPTPADGTITWKIDTAASDVPDRYHP